MLVAFLNCGGSCVGFWVLCAPPEHTECGLLLFACAAVSLFSQFLASRFAFVRLLYASCDLQAQVHAPKETQLFIAPSSKIKVSVYH